MGSSTSGVPASWSATESSPGIAFLKDLSHATLKKIVNNISRERRPNDVVILSIHYGPNWGYDVEQPFRDFAHRLIDQAGVSVVHCHSSHHFKGIEFYHDRLILYGNRFTIFMV